MRRAAHRAWTFLIRSPELVEVGVLAVLREGLPPGEAPIKRAMSLAGSRLKLYPDLVFPTGRAIGDVSTRSRLQIGGVATSTSSSHSRPDFTPTQDPYEFHGRPATVRTGSERGHLPKGQRLLARLARRDPELSLDPPCGGCVGSRRWRSGRSPLGFRAAALRLPLSTQAVRFESRRFALASCLCCTGAPRPERPDESATSPPRGGCSYVKENLL